MSFNQKQNAGTEITGLDKHNLIDAYFDFCSAHYKSQYDENRVIVNLKLVTFPSECSGKAKEFDNSVNLGLDVMIYFNIGVYILSAIGFLGNILSLSIFCRPSFIADHHIAYYCIARSVYDKLMLIFCVIVSYHSGHTGVGTNLGRHGKNDLTESIVDNLLCLSLFGLFMPSEVGTSLLTLTLSFGRYCATAFPLTARVYSTHHNAKKATLVIVVITVLVPVTPFLPTYFLYGSGADCITFSKGPSSNDFLYYTIIWTGLVILLPWVLILIFTILSACKMQEAALNRQQMTSPNANKRGVNRG